MNTIKDIDDAKLGRMIKALLVHTEKGGGSFNISRTNPNRRPFTGDSIIDLPQQWSVQTSNYTVFGDSFVATQAALSHADLGELLDRLAVATR